MESIAWRAAEMEMETAEGMLSPPALGLHFTPSPQELLCYLFLKVGGFQLPPPLSLLGIREKLLYADQAPWEVFQVTPSSPSRDFYCFSSVKKKSERGTGDRFSRVVAGKGAWKATLSPKPIFDEFSDSLIGHHRTLNFTPSLIDKSLQLVGEPLKKKRKSTPCNWIMHEYTLANYPQPATQLWVICKICYTAPPDHSHQHKRGRPLLIPTPAQFQESSASQPSDHFHEAASTPLTSDSTWAPLAPLVSLSPATSDHSIWDSHLMPLPFSESAPTSTITESTWASEFALPPSDNTCSASDPSCSTSQSFRALDDGPQAQPIPAFATQHWDEDQAPPCHPPVSGSVSEHHDMDVPWSQPYTDLLFAPVDDHGYNDACRHDDDDAVATQQSCDDHPPVSEHYDMDLLFAHVDAHGHGDAYQHEDAVDFHRWISSFDIG